MPFATWIRIWYDLTRTSKVQWSSLQKLAVPDLQSSVNWKTTYRRMVRLMSRLNICMQAKRLMQSSLMREMCTSASMTLTVHAFNTMGFWLLLEELFHTRVWKVLETHPKMVLWPYKSSEVGNVLSKPSNINWGIHVLSPTIFNLVMDPLLPTFRQSCLGLYKCKWPHPSLGWRHLNQ